MSTRRAMLALGLTLIPVALAYGQVNQPRSPGVWHAGRFVGFVPAHEQGRDGVSTPNSPRPLQLSLAQATESQVAPAAFVEQEEGTPSATLDLQQDDIPPEESADHTDWAIPLAAVADGPSMRIWGRSEYLLWWTEGMNVPALATTSPDGTPQGQAGVLGSSTTTLFGGSALNDEIRFGGRFTTGLWFDDCQCNGVQVSYLGLADETESFNGADSSGTILARPFFNTQSPGEDARLIDFPGVVSGNLSIAVTTEFQTLEALYRRAAFRGSCARVDYVIGYRFAELQDKLLIGEATQSLAGATAGTTIDLFDQFDTRNRFHGAELGLELQWQCRPCWSWEAVAKVAFGGLDSRAIVAGRETRTTTTSQTFPNGLLAQNTNIGRFQQEDFETISEFGITLKREIPCGMTATIGYSFIYWSHVMRAGDQIDRSINTTQIPPGTLSGAARPLFPFATTGFWAQGLRLGVEYQF